METVENNLKIINSLEVHNIQGTVGNIKFVGNITEGNTTVIISGTLKDIDTDTEIGQLNVNLHPDTDAHDIEIRNTKLSYILEVNNLVNELEKLFKDIKNTN